MPWIIAILILSTVMHAVTATFWTEKGAANITMKIAMAVTAGLTAVATALIAISILPYLPGNGPL